MVTPIPLLNITTICVVFGRMAPRCVTVAMPLVAATWWVLSAISCSLAILTRGTGEPTARLPMATIIRMVSIGQKSNAKTLLTTVVSCSLQAPSPWNPVLSTISLSVCRGLVPLQAVPGLLLNCCAWSTTSAKPCSTTASRLSTVLALPI